MCYSYASKNIPVIQTAKYNLITSNLQETSKVFLDDTSAKCKLAVVMWLVTRSITNV